MFRIILVATLALSLSPGAQAQTSTISLPDTSGVGGQFLFIPLGADFTSPVSGLTFTLLFDANVVQVMDVSTAGAFQDFSLQTNLTAGRLRAALAGIEPAEGTGPVLILS